MAMISRCRDDFEDDRIFASLLIDGGASRGNGCRGDFAYAPRFRRLSGLAGCASSHRVPISCFRRRRAINNYVLKWRDYHISPHIDGIKATDAGR